MSSPNFASLLDAAPTEVNRPKPLPVGTYLCTVGGWEAGKSSRKQTPYVEFTSKVISAMEDVDPEELEAMGGFAGKELRLTYYTTEDAVYRLDEFHEHCGIDLDEAVSRRQRCDEVQNAQVLVKIRHESSQQDASIVFAKVAGTAPAE